MKKMSKEYADISQTVLLTSVNLHWFQNKELKSNKIYFYILKIWKRNENVIKIFKTLNM